MPERPISPPLNKMIREIITPDHTAGFFTELVDRNSPRYQALHPIKRGTKYESTQGADQRTIDAFPSLYFCKEVNPLGFSDVRSAPADNLVLWYWASVPDAENSHNSEISYLGDAIANPVYARSYRILRSTYETTPAIALGSPLTALIGIKVTAPGSGYTTATVGISGGSGSGATAQAVINAAGGISEIIITAEGSGYTTAPAITITGDGTGATATGTIQSQSAVLTSQKKIELPDNDPFSHEFVSVLRTYEVLPGPNLPYTRFDDNLGPVQGYRQAIVYTNQPAALTATGKTTYEARDGSSYVAWKIVEAWSDGTGSAGNPAYPLQTSTEFEKDGVKKVVTRQLKRNADIVTSETLAGGVLTRKFGERYNEFLQYQIIETITVIDADLLDLPAFTTSIPNLIPEIFRAQIPTHVESHIVEGPAEETVLLTGEFEHSERQLTPLYKEVRSTMLDDIGSLPITITGLKETNQNKQVVTVAMKLCTEGTTPTVPTALIDVDFKKLGNGLAIEITKTIPSVFTATQSTVEIPDLVPPEFRAAFPLTTTETSSAGTAANPATLGTGDIRKTEAQIDAFVKRVTTASRGSITFPATLELHETGTEYGGGDIKVLVTINNSVLTIDTGLLVVSSEAKALGGGLYLKITKSLNDTEWPELEGTKVDENLRIAIPFTKQVVAAGATGGVVGNVVTEVQPLEKWRSILIASTIPDDLSELNKTYPTTRNHIFPDTIEDAELIEVWVESVTGASQSFAYDAQVKYKLKSGYRGPCDGQIIETYTTEPDDTSYPVTKFFPEQFIGYTKFFYGYAGDNLVAQARVFVHTLPSSLHDEIDLTPSYGDSDGLIVPATDPIELPAPGTLITVDRNTERWRFGIWRNQVTQIYVP